MKLKDITVGLHKPAKGTPHNKKVWTYKGISYFTSDRVPCIYKIIDTRNGDFYLGSSDIVFSRLSQHLTQLKSNIHDNKRLQAIYNKYGEEIFEFEIFELLPLQLTREEIYHREQELIDELKPSLNLAVKVMVVECTNRVEIHKYSFEGEYICSYPSFLAAANDTRVGVSAIRQASDNPGMVSKGFMWSREKVESLPYKKFFGNSFWKYGNYRIDVYSYEEGTLLSSHTSKDEMLEKYREGKWDWNYIARIMKGKIPCYKNRVYKLNIFGKT